MVKRIVPGALALALTLTLAGCPGGKDPKPESGELSLAEFCASGADRGLLHLACVHGDPSLVSSMAATAAAACAGLEAAVTTGRVVYRGDLAKACADALKSATCDTFPMRLREDCADLLAGTVANGSPCLDDVECANGHCRIEASCPGICTPYVGLDADCSVAGVKCGPGLVCGLNGRCVAGVVNSAQQGQACVTYGCAPGLYCDPVSSTCAPWKKSGSCAEARDACAFGYACVASGSCVAYAGRGEGCGPDAHCGQGWACIAGICGPAPGIGSPCGSMVYGTDCAAGAYCDLSAPAWTCRAQRPDGAGCSSDRQCRSGSCTAGKCEFETCLK
jgi:hypothetical protein